MERMLEQSGSFEATVAGRPLEELARVSGDRSVEVADAIGEPRRG